MYTLLLLLILLSAWHVFSFSSKIWCPNFNHLMNLLKKCLKDISGVSSSAFLCFWLLLIWLLMLSVEISLLFHEKKKKEINHYNYSWKQMNKQNVFLNYVRKNMATCTVFLKVKCCLLKDLLYTIIERIQYFWIFFSVLLKKVPKNHRITQLLRLEGTSRRHLAQPLAQAGIPIVSSWDAQDHVQMAFEDPNEADSTTSLNNLCQCTVTHTAKCFLIFRRNFLHASLFPLTLVLNQFRQQRIKWVTKNVPYFSCNYRQLL